VKRHFLALGILIALACYSIFYLSFTAHLLSLQNVNYIVRTALPFIMGGYALAMGRSYSWFPPNEPARRKLLTTLLPQIALPLAAAAILAADQVGFFLRGLGVSLLTGVSTILFWQGFIWPQMSKTKGHFSAALRLSALQFLLSALIVFITMVPVAGLQSLWGLLSFAGTLKVFEMFRVVAIIGAGLAFTLLIAGLVNFALARMMEWTSSILYPALAYSITTFLVGWAVNSRSSFAQQGAAFLPYLIAIAAIASFIYLYRGAKKLGDSAKAV